MSVIVFRYMQIFCVAVLFDNFSCDQSIQATSSDHVQLMVDSGCTARCMDDDPKKYLEKCYEECVAAGKIYNSPMPSAEPRPTLLPVNATYVTQICRDDTSMVLDVLFHGNASSVDKSNNTQLFIFRLQEENFILNNNIIVISDRPSVHVFQLSPDTKYNVFVTQLDANLEYSVVSNNGVPMVTQRKNTQPGEVTKIRFGEFLPSIENEKLLDVEVIWEPATDNTCYYDVVKHSTSYQDGNMFPDIIEIRDPADLHSTWLYDLPLGSSYTLSVHGINTKNPDLRSNDTEGEILNVPTCLEFYKNNMTLCKPYKPSGLRVHVTLTAVHAYQLNVSWDQPPVNPLAYTVSLTDSSGSSHNFTVNGSETQLVISQPLQLLDNPMLRVYAVSEGGTIMSAHPIKLKDAYMDVAATFDTLQKVIFIVLMLAMSVFLIFAAIWAWTHKDRRKRNSVRNAYFKNLEKVASGDSEAGLAYKENLFSQIYALQKDVDAASFYHQMEVDKDAISFERVIGQGAFGLVRRAVLTTDGRTVAVKTLHDLPTVEEMKAFYGEIEVMKSVNKHPNIVGIIGHHTKNVRQMMLLTEYCDEGNLLTFLQKIYRHLGKDGDLFARVCESVDSENDLAGGPLMLGHKLQCQTPASAKLKSAECTFNFDTTNNEKDFCTTNKMTICQQESEDRDEDDSTLPAYSVLNESLSNNSSVESNGEPSPPALNPRNLVVNKLYDVGRNDPNQGPTACSSACKCQVEIVSDDSGFSSDIHRRSTIRIRDCDCATERRISSLAEVNNNVDPVDFETLDQENLDQSKKNHQERFPLMVANPSYMLSRWSSPQGKPSLVKPMAMLPLDKPIAKLPPVSEIRPDHIEITSQDLLSFAEQIASGMEFLSLNKVVHRDLAARNVLVCSNKTVKISDFGLSRDVYQNNVYNKLGDGKLPIKWMAVESLLRRTYTSQSDVWSFGILLYEIVTLGRTPYPHIQHNDELIKFLQAEQRMDQPSTCSNELYDMMRSCWETDPEQRPIFGQIRTNVQEIIHLATKSGEEHVRLDKHAATIAGRQLYRSKPNQNQTAVLIPTGEKEEADQAYLTPLSSP